MRLVVSLLVAVFAAALLLVPSAAAAKEPGDPCEGSTTLAINECYDGKLQTAQAEMNRYLQAAIDRYLESEEDAVVLGLRNSQAAFEAYRAIECETVYEHWKGGTIRTLNSLVCSIALTDQRTHAIWASWLTYPDSTPPTLPEPTTTE